jgi:hypothetical protein
MTLAEHACVAGLEQLQVMLHNSPKVALLDDGTQ